MTKNSQDELIRAYTMLSSLQKNVGNIREDIVSDTYINEYHTILDKLQNIDIEVADFRIPDSEIKPHITSSH